MLLKIYKKLFPQAYKSTKFSKKSITSVMHAMKEWL